MVVDILAAVVDHICPRLDPESTLTIDRESIVLHSPNKRQLKVRYWECVKLSGTLLLGYAYDDFLVWDLDLADPTAFQQLDKQLHWCYK